MAQLKNTTISDTGSIDLPVGTTGQRPGSPIAAMIRYNTTLSETEYYDGTAWRPLSDSNPEATGGTIVDTDIGGVPYRIHYFTNTGNTNFVVTKGGEVEYLIVAGGGGGAGTIAGGGGAGGLLTGTTTVTAQAYAITVGSGGLGGFQWNNQTAQFGVSGTNSSAFGLSAVGGGGGGSHSSANGQPTAGQVGGSAGGSGASNTSTAGIAGQGNAGGTGGGNNGGGGGGAGSAGLNHLNAVRAGNGGQGIVSSISGNNQFYAGGGGGGTRAGSGVPGIGGLGGGGNGAVTDITKATTDGTTNTGGGGGGGGHNGSSSGAIRVGGAGGSGIVVVRYRRNASTATTPSRSLIATVPNNYNVIRSNLVYYLDAANPVSYPGTGTVWNNIGATNVNGSLRNGPTFVNRHGGYIQFAGGSQDSITSSTPIEIQGNPNLTVSGWFRRTAIWPGNQGTWGIGGNETNRGINSWTSNNPNEIMIDVWSSGTFTTGVQYPLQEWVFVTWQKIAGAMTRANCILWRNLDSYTGTQLTIIRAESGVPDINNQGISLARISPTYSSPFPVQIGEFLIYNRVLTASEVAHNFNVTRSRYGA